MPALSLIQVLCSRADHHFGTLIYPRPSPHPSGFAQNSTWDYLARMEGTVAAVPGDGHEVSPAARPWIWGAVTGVLDRHNMTESLPALPPAPALNDNLEVLRPLIEAGTGRCPAGRAAQGLGVTTSTVSRVASMNARPPLQSGGKVASAFRGSLFSIQIR